MMYNNKLTAAIKVDGKILRESQDTVYLPFGSEFSIFLKNLDTKTALVRVSIDGNDVTSSGLVLGPSAEVNLERFIGANLNTGNRFKFIERNAAVEQHRGIQAEDGLVRIEYQFEASWGIRTPQSYPWANTNIYGGYNTCSASARPTTGIGGSSVGSSSVGLPKDGLMRACNLAANNVVTDSTYTASVNDVGITVPGSISNQQFVTTTIGLLQMEKHCMVFRLVGEVNNHTVTKPVTVATKPRCVTCNRQNRATSKFCSSCGTSLTVIV